MDLALYPDPFCVLLLLMSQVSIQKYLEMWRYNRRDEIYIAGWSPKRERERERERLRLDDVLDLKYVMFHETARLLRNYYNV